MNLRGENMSSEKQATKPFNPQNLRLRRMFQTDPSEQREISETDAWMKEDLERIVLRFEQPEIKPLSLIDALNRWMEKANITPTQSLLEYIEGLRAQYDVEGLDEDQGKEEVDIEALIKQSEAEILQEEDKKALLYSLIQDVSKGDERTKSHPDLSFEQNLQKLFEEEDEGKAISEEPSVSSSHDEWLAGQNQENNEEVAVKETKETDESVDEIEDMQDKDVDKELKAEIDEKNIVAIIDEEDYYEDVQFITRQEAQRERNQAVATRRKLSPLVKLFFVFLLVIGFIIYLMYQAQIHSLFKQWFDILRKMI